MKFLSKWVFTGILLSAGARFSHASMLVEVLAVDNRCIVIHWQDGMVRYNWDDTISGSCNGWDAWHTENWHLCPDKDQYIPFGLPLNTSLAQQENSFRIISGADLHYGESGKQMNSPWYRLPSKSPTSVTRQAPCINRPICTSGWATVENAISAGIQTARGTCTMSIRGRSSIRGNWNSGWRIGRSHSWRRILPGRMSGNATFPDMMFRANTAW